MRKPEWNRVKNFDTLEREFLPLYEHLKDMATPDFDADAFIGTEMGERLLELLAPFYKWNEADQAVFDYWRDKGLNKELHDEDESDTMHLEKWSVFVPTSAEADPHKRYPAIIYSRGSRPGGTQIFCEENFGIAELAAKEQIIIALAEKNNEEGIMSLYQRLTADYPVDKNKIYLAGFSAGATASVSTAIKHPGLFAAVCSITGSPSLLDVSDEEIAAAAGTGMPMIAIGGLCEMTLKFPICKDTSLHPSPKMSKEAKVRGLNAFKLANGLEPASLEEVCSFVADSEDGAVRKVGVDAQLSHTQRIMGLEHYFCDYLDDTGKLVIRFTAIENHPHHPAPSAFGLMWDFFKSHSRG